MNTADVTTFHARAGRLAIAAAAALAVLLQGCETTSHAQQGEVIGGVIGGVVGSQIGGGDGTTVAIIVGTLAGAMIGRHIGQHMDDTDRLMTARALNDSRTNESTTWVNPDTGYEYTVTPTRTYEVATGPCREFRLDATVDGRTDRDLGGDACLQPDGSWLVQ